MSEISDELRLSADDMERNQGVCQQFSPNFLRELADRIDDAMVEWPLGADKKPVKPSQTVYDEYGRAWHVRGVTIGESPIVWDDHNVHVTSDAGEWHCFKPEWLTHERPDSWERIADELDEWRFEHMHYLVADDLNDLGLFAERTRRLAEREDGR